jgi:class 3 adenylate cyclase
LSSHCGLRKADNLLQIITFLNYPVNTASRMESSSQPNRLQVSQKTAELVVEAGKGHWLTARKDLVNAKGKGLLQMYWLDPSGPGLLVLLYLL